VANACCHNVVNSAFQLLIQTDLLIHFRRTDSNHSVSRKIGSSIRLLHSVQLTEQPTSHDNVVDYTRLQLI